MDYVLLLHRPLWLRGLSQRCCGPETGKADARTNAPPDTGERDGRHVGLESCAVNRGERPCQVLGFRGADRVREVGCLERACEFPTAPTPNPSPEEEGLRGSGRGVETAALA